MLLYLRVCVRPRKNWKETLLIWYERPMSYDESKKWLHVENLQNKRAF